MLSASTWHPHTERGGSARLEVELEEKQHGSGVAEKLFRVATEAGWIGERLSVDEWAPTRLADGSRVRGMSAALLTRGDWGLRVELASR